MATNNPAPAQPTPTKPAPPHPHKTKGAVKSVLLAAAGIAVAGGSVFAGSLKSSTENIDVLRNGCSIIGKETDPTTKHAKENALKNRYGPVSPEEIDPDATLEALKAAPESDPPVFDQNKGAEMVGTIVNVRLGGNESCNCGEEKDHALMDTHIYVGPLGSTVNTPKSECLIVEVTPRVRQLMAEQGVDWSTDTLIKALTGRNVRIGGWLFFDGEHKSASVADKSKLKNPWRASCWELHPVTDIQVIDGLSKSDGKAAKQTPAKNGAGPATGQAPGQAPVKAPAKPKPGSAARKPRTPGKVSSQPGP